MTSIHSPTRGRHGFSILEAVVALFIIASAALFAGQMLQISLRTSGYVKDESMAMVACDRRLREITEWSRQAAIFDATWPDGLETVAAAPFAEAPDPDQPGIRVYARAFRRRLYSPSRAMTRADLAQSARLVKVTAVWGSDRRSLSIVGLITDPPRRLASISVSLTPAATLGPGAAFTLQAMAGDAAGRPIPDVVCAWEVVPIDGNVSLSSTVGASVPGTNTVTYPNGQRYCTGGRCRVRAHAMAGGVRRVGEIILDLGTPSGPL